MDHSQFTAFVEGIDFKVLPTGKFDKIYDNKKKKKKKQVMSEKLN